MPQSPPIRKNAGDYHYHAYNFDNAAAWTQSAPQPERNDWRFYSMVRDLWGLSVFGKTRGVPNIASTRVGGETQEGRKTIVLSFGNKGNLTGQPTVVITGGIHAREWAATEMAYLLAEYLVVNYTPEKKNETKYQRAIRELIDARNIHIIPMLNPDGNYYTVFGGGADSGPARLWRKNCRPLPATAEEWVAALTTEEGSGPPFKKVANQPFKDVELPSSTGGRASYKVPKYEPTKNIPPNDNAEYERYTLRTGEKGVDLNRNFATTAWGYESAIGTPTPEDLNYFGPKAGSETETRNIQEFVTSLGDIATTIDYHSYGRFILYPDETAGKRSPDYECIGLALQSLVKSQAGLPYEIGSAKGLLKYYATGTNADYMALNKQARAFTIEVDPKVDPANVDSGFLLPETDLMALFETNIRGALAAIAAPSREEDMSAAVDQFQSWDVYGRGNQLPVKDLPG